MKIKTNYGITSDGRLVYVMHEDNRGAWESNVPHISGVYRFRDIREYIMFFYRDNDGH